MTPKERAKTLCSLIRSYGGAATPAEEMLIAEAMRIGERDARATGYAEAIEKAARVCESHGGAHGSGFAYAAAIREELASTATTETK